MLYIVGMDKASEKIASGRVLQTILNELRALRENLLFFLPQDDLSDYSHPRRVKRSYQKALKQFPPWHGNN